jgi:hypothetical protein
MKIILFVLVLIFSLNAFSFEVVTSTPACFMTDFQSLESAVKSVGIKADNLCKEQLGANGYVVLSNAQVTKNASCNGFTVRAWADCYQE